MQSLLDIKGIIQVRIVDQAFPAYGGAWLLEVHAHDDQQCIADFIGELFQSGGIIAGSFYIVNRAGAYDDEQTVILAIHNVVDGLPTIGNGFGCLV